MRRLFLFATTILSLFVAGCGGSGSSVDSGALSGTGGSVGTAYNGPNKGMLSFFVTNTSGEAYDHAWVVMKKVALKLASGGTRTIYEDQKGIGLDLASLHDATSPVNQFLSGMTVPVGTYTGVQVTVFQQATFFPSKSDQIMGASFPGKDDNGDSLISLDFDAPKVLGSGAENLVLDFNLGEWKSKDEKLDPKLKVNNGAEVKTANYAIPTFLQGQVAELKGKSPDLTFVLRQEKGVDMPVHSGSTSVIQNLGPKSNLKNGSWIEMSGNFDVDAHRFEAASITVAERKDQLSDFAVQGVVASVEEHGGMFQVLPVATRGFAPTAVKIAVSTKSASVSDRAGKAMDKVAFYQALSQGKGVEVQVRGSFDPKRQLFTATQVQLTSSVKPAPSSAQPKMLKA